MLFINMQVKKKYAGFILHNTQLLYYFENTTVKTSGVAGGGQNTKY